MERGGMSRGEEVHGFNAGQGNELSYCARLYEGTMK